MSHDFFRDWSKLLLLCDVPFRPISGGFTSYPLSSPVTEWLMPLLNGENQGKNSCAWVLCLYPLPTVTHRYPYGHCPRHCTAQHTQQASLREKHFGPPLPVCIFLLKYTHSQAQRGEECLALLRWLSGRSTTPFSGNSTKVLEQLFQFLIQALQTEDQVTFLSSHQH